MIVNVLGFLLGASIASILSWFAVSTIVRNVDKKFEEKYYFKNNVLNDAWVQNLKIGKGIKDNSKILGMFESLIFYSSLAIGRPEGIAVWLTFKIAAKWESWANIIKAPNKIEGINTPEGEFEYLGVRNRFATDIMQRFLIGTAGNIIAAFIGSGVYLSIKHMVIQ